MPEEPRPAASPATNGASTAIVTNIAVIASWLVGLAIQQLPVQPPAQVSGALDFLVLTTVAFAVAYVAGLLRDREFRSTGDVTGIKKLL